MQSVIDISSEDNIKKETASCLRKILIMFRTFIKNSKKEYIFK